MVEQAARGGDQHVDTAVDQLVLVLEADAADQQRHRELVVLAVVLEVLGHLGGQLAGRAQDQRARHPRPGPALGQHGDHRQHETGGLAGAGLGDAEHVAAFQRVGDRLRLDRRRVGIASFRDGFEHARIELEISELHVIL